MQVPPVTIIFLTYATSLIKAAWSGSDKTVFLSSLVKKSKFKKKNQNQTQRFLEFKLMVTLIVHCGVRHHLSEPPCHSQIWRLNLEYSYLRLASMNSAMLGTNDHTMPPRKTKLFAYVNSWKSKTNQPKKYKTLIFLIMLGHMQKISHFWAQMKKNQNVSQDVFALSPSLRICSFQHQQSRQHLIESSFISAVFL